MRFLPVFILFLLSILNCVTHNEYYRLLDSMPCVNYAGEQTTPLPDKPAAFSVKGAFSTINASPDSSIRRYIAGGSFHMNFARNFGISFNGNSIFAREHFFFGSIESRYWLQRGNIFFAPSLGFGAGSGSVGPIADLRLTPGLFIKIKESSYWFIVPRIAILTYPARIEAGIVPKIDYEMAVVFSAGSGINIKLWQPDHSDNSVKIMMAPEISFSATRERNTGTNISLISFTIYLTFVL